MPNSDMVADGSSSGDRAKAPRFQELNFKSWKKFFLAFLMRYDRAHLAIEDDDPSKILTEEQVKSLNEEETKSLMEVCNLHDKANTIASLYEGRSAATHSK